LEDPGRHPEDLWKTLEDPVDFWKTPGRPPEDPEDP